MLAFFINNTVFSYLHLVAPDYNTLRSNVALINNDSLQHLATTSCFTDKRRSFPRIGPAIWITLLSLEYSHGLIVRHHRYVWHFFSRRLFFLITVKENYTNQFNLQFNEPYWRNLVVN